MLPTFSNSSLAIAIADFSLLPEPIIIANSSALDKFDNPTNSSLSRGLESILIFFIDIIFPKKTYIHQAKKYFLFLT